jgi:hypothetical protein
LLFGNILKVVWQLSTKEMKVNVIEFSKSSFKLTNLT